MSFLKNRTVVGVICILLSLLICFGLTPLFNQSVSQKAEIVRVVQPIRAGDEITESMVQIVEVGGYNLPDGGRHSSAPVEAEQKGQIGPGVMPGLSDPT